MHHPLIPVIALLALAGCAPDGSLTPRAQQLVGAACKVDAMAQPVAVTIAPILLPQTTPAATIDAALVHPAVVKACAAIGGTPAAATLAPAPAPAATK